MQWNRIKVQEYMKSDILTVTDRIYKQLQWNRLYKQLQWNRIKDQEYMKSDILTVTDRIYKQLQ